MKRIVSAPSRRVALGLGVLALVSAAIASAAIDAGVSNNRGGFAWSAQAVHRHSGQLDPARKGDPITLIFRGGGSNSSSAVKSYVAADWDSGASLPGGSKPNGTFRMHDINPFCRDPEYVTFRWNASSSAVPMSFTGSTSRHCLGAQYHIRFWSDATHAQQSGQAAGQWVIGSAHHDHLVWHFPTFSNPVPAHHGTPNMSFDLTRVAVIHSLHSHCSYRIWHVNKAARMKYQGMTPAYSGRISRISARTSRPCDGG
jgi:hypothetical protein